jgi:hypothetical protein
MFKLDQLQDLFADAIVVDEHFRLVFCSLYGRDTALQQLFAAFSLPLQSGGADCISINHPESGPFKAFVGSADRLERFSGRLPRENVFGNLSHAWIFDPTCKMPDRVNGSAWLLGENLQGLSLQAQAWQMTKVLSPLPLLDHWQEIVLQHCQIIRPEASKSIGRIRGVKLQLPTDFEERIVWLVQSKQISLHETPPLNQNSGSTSSIAHLKVA